MGRDLREILQVPCGRRVRLKDLDPDATFGIRDKEQARKRLAENIAELARLQYRLYAENRRSVLVVLQAMDAGGKDGVIRHVMSGLNPQGCTVTPFKVPSPEELDHDFLWRVHRAAPPRGEIGVFNRSHYEDVLVVRVHNLVPRGVWKRRYDQINAFERILVENGTVMVKCFLHISRDEQLDRLQARLAAPDRHWKLSEADVHERSYWSKYAAAYEDALARCSTPEAPWYWIPANRKWYRDYAVSTILLETLKDMALKFPKPTADLKVIADKLLHAR